MTSLLSVVLLLASLLIVPNQPTANLHVIVIYRNFRGEDKGIGAGWPIEVSQGGNLIRSAETDSASQHTFVLSTSDRPYLIEVEFTGGTFFVDYQCLQFYRLTEDAAIIIRCLGRSWLPFLSGQ